MASLPRQRLESRILNNEEYAEGNLYVESKVFNNDDFGYTKVAVETPVCDENGQPILKKGKKQPDKSKADTEIIPLTEDIDSYIAKNVLPYNQQELQVNN